MKSNLLTALIIFISCSAYSQVDRYTIVGSTYIQKDKDSKFLYQKEWNKKISVGVMNIPKKRFEIFFDSTESEFSITSMDNSYKDAEGNLIFNMQAVDDNKVNCTLTFITLVDSIEGFRNFIKVEFPFSIILFRCLDQ